MLTDRSGSAEVYPICGVGALVRENDRYLLIKRGRAPNEGQWAVPGGKVRWGERMKEAVAREVLEETGLTVEVGEPVWVGEAIDAAMAWHLILIDFEATLVGGDLEVGDDATEAGWFTRAEATALPLTATMVELFESLP